MKEEPGSFRDPAGRIFYYENKILRILNEDGLERYNFIEKNQIIKKAIEKKFLIKTKLSNEEKIKILI